MIFEKPRRQRRQEIILAEKKLKNQILEMRECKKTGKNFFELQRLRKSFVEDFSLFLKSLKSFEDDFNSFLLEVGKSFMELFSTDISAQKNFLDKVLEETPWFLRKVTGPVDIKTGMSKNGFDMKLLDDSMIMLSSGYLKEKSDSPLFTVKLMELSVGWFRACTEGNIKLMKKFIALGINPYYMRNIAEDTGIHVLAQTNPEKLMDFLKMLENHSDFCSSENLKELGLVPHHIALSCPEKLLDILPGLKKLNIDMNQKNKYAKPFVNILVDYHVDVLREMLPVLIEEYEIGLSGSISSSIEEDIVFRFFSNPSLDENELDLLLTLLQDYKKLDLKKKDRSGKTAIWYLLLYYPERFLKFAPVLIKYGLDEKSAQDLIFAQARINGTIDLFEKILVFLYENFKVDVNKEDENGWTPLDYALERSSDEADRVLAAFVNCKVDFKYLNKPQLSAKEKSTKEKVEKFIEDFCLPLIDKKLNRIETNIMIILDDKNRSVSMDCITQSIETDFEDVKKFTDSLEESGLIQQIAKSIDRTKDLRNLLDFIQNKNKKDSFLTDDFFENRGLIF